VLAKVVGNHVGALGYNPRQLIVINVKATRLWCSEFRGLYVKFLNAHKQVPTGERVFSNAVPSYHAREFVPT
jgi:hypothetical protein